MKLFDVILLSGLKRKLGNLIRALGAVGLTLPAILPDGMPMPTNSASLKVLALGIIIKYLGELHAKYKGENIKEV